MRNFLGTPLATASQIAPVLSVLVGHRNQRVADSAALRVATIQARHAAVHHDDGRGAAAAAQLGAFREVLLGEGIGLPGASPEFGAFLVHQLLLMWVELGLSHE